jgi:acyl-CoA thioester hydrolase
MAWLVCSQVGLYNPTLEKRSSNLIDEDDKGTTMRKSSADTKAAPDLMVAQSRVRVRYAETDQMGVAYYANYLVWFEVGRSQYCNDCGFSYRDMERETGLYLIVAEATCRYKSPARYEDVLIVRTNIKELTRRTVRFGYEIRLEDGAEVATGETLHVLINGEGRPSSFPSEYLAMLRKGLVEWTD